MTARTGMTALILALRGMTDAGSADYTLGTAVYWDDDHVQDVLDRHRQDIYQEPLFGIEKWISGGSIGYFEYQSAYGNLEATTGGTAIWYIEDGTGVDIGTVLYSVDYARGRVTFAADTLGTVYYMTGRSYNLYASAADLWRVKASQAAKVFDFSTDNHNLRRSQIMEHYLKMASYYDNQAGANSIAIERNDKPW